MTLRESVINDVLKDPSALATIPRRSIHQRSVRLDVVTSLPKSPANGDQVIYDTGTAGVRWVLVYDNSDGQTYPWLFIGGSALYAETITSETRANTAFGDLSGGATGPTITLPLAGDYDVSMGCQANNDTDSRGAMMSFAKGATAAVDADGIEIFQAGATSITATNYRTKRHAALVGGDALTAKYRTTTGGTATFFDRSISAIPIRVGA